MLYIPSKEIRKSLKCILKYIQFTQQKLDQNLSLPGTVGKVSNNTVREENENETIPGKEYKNLIHTKVQRQQLNEELKGVMKAEAATASKRRKSFLSRQIHQLYHFALCDPNDLKLRDLEEQFAIRVDTLGNDWISFFFF